MSPRRRPLGWVLPALLSGAGLAAVAAGAVLWASSAPAVPPSTGAVPTGTASHAPAFSSSTTASRPVPSPTVPVRVAAPSAVRLAGGQRAAVVPVGTGTSGQLDPPTRVSQVGWWRGGAGLEAPAGSLVLVGHVDAADQGVGVFAALRSARPGQKVVVSGGGRSVTYRVTGVRAYPRSRALPASVFDGNVAPRLVMITCTGTFNERTFHYSDSLVVYGVPLETTP